MAYNQSVKNKAKELYKQGNSILSISNEMGIGRATITKFIKEKANNKHTKANNRVGRPMLFTSVEELEEKIEAYFKSCWDYKRDMFGGRIEDKILNHEYDENDKSKGNKWLGHEFIMEQVKPYTVSGLAIYLKTSRETLMNYEKRDEYFDTIKNAKDRVYAFVEESLFKGRPTGAIFSLKNNYGWKNKHVREDIIPVTIIDDSDEVARLTRERKELLAHESPNPN